MASMEYMEPAVLCYQKRLLNLITHSLLDDEFEVDLQHLWTSLILILKFCFSDGSSVLCQCSVTPCPAMYEWWPTTNEK